MLKTRSSMLKTIVFMFCVGKSLSIFTTQISSGDGFKIFFRQNNACEASCRTTSMRCCVHREQCLDESCAALLSKKLPNQSAWSDWSVGQSNACEPSCRTTSVCCFVHREQCLDESCAGLLSKKLLNQSVWSDWSGMLTKEFELGIAFSSTNHWGNLSTRVFGSCVFELIEDSNEKGIEFSLTNHWSDLGILCSSSCVMRDGSFSFLDETLFNRSSSVRWLISIQNEELLRFALIRKYSMVELAMTTALLEQERFGAKARVRNWTKALKGCRPFLAAAKSSDLKPRTSKCRSNSQEQPVCYRAHT
jgi:hypothetical protein